MKRTRKSVKKELYTDEENLRLAQWLVDNRLGDDKNFPGEKKKEYHIRWFTSCRVSLRTGDSMSSKELSLKKAYQTTKQWIQSTGQGVKNDHGDEHFETCVLKRCPWFRILEELMETTQSHTPSFLCENGIQKRATEVEVDPTINTVMIIPDKNAVDADKYADLSPMGTPEVTLFSPTLCANDDSDEDVDLAAKTIADDRNSFAKSLLARPTTRKRHFNPSEAIMEGIVSAKRDAMALVESKKLEFAEKKWAEEIEYRTKREEKEDAAEEKQAIEREKERQHAIVLKKMEFDFQLKLAELQMSFSKK